MTEEKSTFLRSLKTLEPFLSSDAKKELDALEQITAVFPSSSLADITKRLVKWKADQRKTPEVLIERIKAFRSGTPDVVGSAPETVETLVADFAGAVAATVKKIGAAFKINLVDKKDAPLFERWLRTGVEPPTADEKLRDTIRPFAENALELRDRSRNELSDETIRAILDVAERVKTAHKIDGLKVFMRLVDVEPQSKTAAKLLVELKTFLDGVALNRFKGMQIQKLNG